MKGRWRAAALGIVLLLSAPSMLHEADGQVGPTAVERMYRLVVMHKLEAGAGELLSAPDLQVLQDYRLFSVGNGTDDTIAWLDLQAYTWWTLPEAFSHGNFTWDPLHDVNPIPQDLRLNASETDYHLLMFKAPILPEWITEVREAGRLIGYSSNRSVVVNMSEEGIQHLYGLNLLRAAEPYHPGLKLSPCYERVTQETDVVATVMTDYAPAALEEKLKAIDEIVTYWIDAITPNNTLGVAYLNVTPAGLRDLAHLDGIQSIENLTTYRETGFSDVGLSQQNSSTAGHALSSHPYRLTGRNQTVTIAEWNFELNETGRPVHPAFADDATRPDPIIVSLVGITPGDLEQLPEMPDHGMKVAGMVGANVAPYDEWFYNSSTGDSDGHAFGAKLHWQVLRGSARNTTDAFTNRTVPVNLSDVLEDSYSRGGRIHTNSWTLDIGSLVPLYGANAYFIDQFVWTHDNFSVFFAMGNGGHLGIQRMPAAKNLVAVSATNLTGPHGAEDMAYAYRKDPKPVDHWFYFSAWGDDAAIALECPGLHLERQKPLLAAPGVGVRTTSVDGTYTSATGTSFATPLVAGEAALVRQYFQEGFYPTGERSEEDGFDPSAALIKATLLAASHQIRAGYGSGPCDDGTAQCSPTARADHAETNLSEYPNHIAGWGRPVLDDVLFFANEAGYPLPNGAEGPQRNLIAWDRQTLTFTESTVEKKVYEFDVLDARVPLNVSLVWTDIPALPNARYARVADFNLRVVEPGLSPQSYYGNIMMEPAIDSDAGESRPYGEGDVKPVPDLHNVEEVVRVSSPTQGSWRVEVYPFQVPEAVAYALVVSGAVQEVGTSSVV